MNLITDRTESDVLLGTEKGRYGAEDLNRVESAVKELVLLCSSLGLKMDLTVKTDWTLPEAFSQYTWPAASQMERYLGNVNALCSAVEIAAEIPQSMERLTFEGANQIEKALLLTYERIRGVLQILRYSGEFYAGEENGL